MQVVSCAAGGAVCEGRGGHARLDLALVGDQPAGTWLLAFRGTAMRVLSQDEARATNAALDALDAVLAGDTDVDRHFADLVAREPELPPHLRGNRR
jgi:hydrogenase expression/formation protein HypC